VSSRVPRLEANEKSIASVELALNHARQLHDVLAPERNASLELWLACLTHALEQLQANRTIEIRSDWLANVRKISRWDARAFKRFLGWHEAVVAADLVRLAKAQGLIAVSLQYVPATLAGPNVAIIRVIPYRKQLPEKASSARDANEASRGSPRSGSTAPTEPEPKPLAEPAEEAAFVARLGFDAPPKVRAELAEIKARYEFTDRELRYLKRAGALSIRRDEVNLRPNPFLLWTGCALFVPLAVALLHAVVRFVQIPGTQLQATLIMFTVMVVYIALGYLVYWGLCAPYFLIRRRMEARDTAPKTPKKRQPQAR